MLRSMSYMLGDSRTSLSSASSITVVAPSMGPYSTHAMKSLSCRAFIG